VSGRAFPGGLALRWRFAEGDTNAPRLAIELLQAMVPKLRRLVIFIGAARRKPTIHNARAGAAAVMAVTAGEGRSRIRERLESAGFVFASQHAAH